MNFKVLILVIVLLIGSFIFPTLPSYYQNMAFAGGLLFFCGVGLYAMIDEILFNRWK